ncbi:hypothetical protein CR203_14045 [Salipaludibacillus neizhouensis]|uniref:LacI family transcriptional regulator n=1 Tax=Salipaludibacillus neizhouensis TaxID=885475 RepID=A0A3A9KBI5_9BACI|nr:hypothetical protein [Salipaludibacillus neizhouensis]RKL66943.1 hypothetical protein CR203_14045 [Salipaludibacillus neizhouensis]
MNKLKNNIIIKAVSCDKYEERKYYYIRYSERSKCFYIDSLQTLLEKQVDGTYILVEASAQLLNLKDKPTAVVCVNDFFAMGAINMFTKIGLRVTDDIYL